MNNTTDVEKRNTVEELAMKTIDMTPTWQTIVTMCCEVMTNPNAGREAQESCKEELLGLAKIVDDQNASIHEIYYGRKTTLGDIIEEERKKGNLL
jgi:hypothetical protein